MDEGTQAVFAFHGARAPESADYPAAGDSLSIATSLYDFTLDPARRAIDWRLGPAKAMPRQVLENPFLQRVVRELDDTAFSPGFGGELMGNNDVHEDAFTNRARDYAVLSYAPGPSRASAGNPYCTPVKAASPQPLDAWPNDMDDWGFQEIPF